MRANPKSQSLMTECFVIRMFSGFTSRWMHWKQKKTRLEASISPGPQIRNLFIQPHTPCTLCHECQPGKHCCRKRRPKDFFTAGTATACRACRCPRLDPTFGMRRCAGSQLQLHSSVSLGRH